MTNRRRKRSDDPAVALKYFLEAEAERCGALAMALGTLDGLPIAAWGAGDGLSLAAAGGLFAAGDRAGARAVIADLRALVLDAGGQGMVLSSRGGDPPRAESVDKHVARILG